MLVIKKVETECDELVIVRQLFREYADELNEDLCFQSFDKELKDPLKKYGPPHGSIYIAYYHNEAAGCIALQKLPEEGVCEMKRLYVKPGLRKHGIGDELVSILLVDAESKDYTTMVLDTLERLKPAIELYHRHGFKNISAYYKNPLPHVVYMKKMIGK